jgi:hypothetical protein
LASLARAGAAPRDHRKTRRQRPPLARRGGDTDPRGGDDDIAAQGPVLISATGRAATCRQGRCDGQDGSSAAETTVHFDGCRSPRTELRLHIDALGAGPLATVGAGLEAVGVTRLEGIGIDGTAGADGFVVSSDAGVLGPEASMYIATGAGRDRVDARNVRSRTSIDCGSSTRDTAGDVVRGSLEFFDYVSTGPGDDEIWTGRGGSLVRSSLGRDEIHLGAGPDRISLGTGYSRGAKVVSGFGADDIVDLYDIHSDWPRVLDTSGDGRLDAGTGRCGSGTGA